MTWAMEHTQIQGRNLYELPVQVPPVEDMDGSVVVGSHVFQTLGYATAQVELLAFELSAAVTAKRFFEANVEKVRVAQAAKILNKVLPPSCNWHHLEKAARALLSAIDKGQV